MTTAKTANPAAFAAVTALTWEAIMAADWNLVNVDRGQFYQYASDDFAGQLEIEFADANAEFSQDWAYIAWATYRDDVGVTARWQRPNGRQWQA